MERKEPYATQEEFNQRVIRYRDIPLVELVPGSKSHIVSTERMTVSFLTMAPNSHFAVHHHESEQIMIVLDGACDEIIEGKLYHLEEGDVVILPSNTEHGGYISERSCRVIDIFSPPRQDYVAKLEAVKKGSPT
ncbi:MAG: cupin domain-containing protein [Dehalococcoidales bacterium]